MFMLFNVLHLKRHRYKNYIVLASRQFCITQDGEANSTEFVLHSPMTEKALGSWKETFYIPPCRKCLVSGGRPVKFCVVWKSPGHITETFFAP